MSSLAKKKFICLALVFCIFVKYTDSALNVPFVFTSAPTNTSSAYSFFIPAPPKAPTSAMSDDPIFSELMNATARGGSNVAGEDNNARRLDEEGAAGKTFVTVDDFQMQRGKRGAIQLGEMMKCATGCNPLSYKGYGCYCGFLGSGKPVDGIDKCCKMHDWCYTTTTCMDLQWHLPYFVPFKWKCNGGAPYCIPGKKKSTGRDSCPHQLCECDREFAMCLRNFSCPKSQAMCRESKPRFLQNVLMGFGLGKGVHDPHAKNVNHGHHRGHHGGHNQFHQAKPRHGGRQPKRLFQTIFG